MATPANSGAAVIEPDKARAFLKADAANLAKRLQLGHTLTAAERRHMEALAAGATDPDPTFVRSVYELAAVIGVERKTIQRWAKLEGAPEPRPDGRLEVAAWRAFKATRRAGERDEEGTTDEKEKSNRLKNEKLQIEIAALKHEYIERAEVEQWVSGMIIAAKNVLLGLPSALAMQVVGLNPTETEALIRQGINEALDQLHADPIRGIADLAAVTKQDEEAEEAGS